MVPGPESKRYDVATEGFEVALQINNLLTIKRKQD